MPYCPQCNYEYRTEVKTCPECDVDLVDLLDEQSPDTNYTEIYTVSNRMEADMICFILEESNIDFLVRDLRTFPVLPDFGRRAELRIAVAEGTEEKAREILKNALADGALTSQGDFL